MIKSNSSKMYEFASSNYISDFVNTEPHLNIIYDEYQELNKTSNKLIIEDLIPMISNTNQFVSDFYSIQIILYIYLTLMMI